MSSKKSKKGTFFFKYFFIFSAIILVSFFVIGTALMGFVTNFLSNRVLEDTDNSAKQISTMSEGLLDSEMIKRNPEGVIITLCKNVELLSKATGYDVFVCDAEGKVFICPESLPNYDVNVKNNCEKHDQIKIPPTYLSRVKNGKVSEFSTLGTTYPTFHSVSMEPIYVEDQYIGFAVVTSPFTGEILSHIEKLLLMFLGSAAIALGLVTIVVYFMTGKIAKPINNLETATNCYAQGDFTYRVPELKANDELAHLITRFNAMASSLSELENSRRSFVANVSHEFKTPMTTIGGFINGILDGTIPPEKQNYYLKIVSSEIKRLSRMVNMMLNISKIETGNIDIKIETFDISQKLVSTFLGFEQLISNKNIEVCGFEDLKEAVVHGDSAMIDQVIYNLTDNAVKFTNEGGKITINTATDKHFVYFAITNTGKGIPKKDLEKVFERFYKVDQSRSTDVKSTGLGLYLIKSIVTLHNGTITVESEPNEYTRFTVKLPK